MSKAILVIDDIPESMFTEKISIKYKLIYYPDGQLKELGICGKHLLKPLPHNDFIHEAEGYQTEEEYNAYVSGWNDCLDTLLGEEE